MMIYEKKDRDNQSTCAICAKEIAGNDAYIRDMRTKQPFCSDRCSKAYLLVKCLWYFAGKKTECRGQGTHPTRTPPLLRTEEASRLRHWALAPERVELWDAIHAYARASYTGEERGPSGARMDAVVRVENAVTAVVAMRQRTEPSGSRLTSP